jgi:hypothetical protein
LGTYFVRQVTKFNNRRTQFLKTLSENLYFRSLDHDIGVFHHLLGAAEETLTTTTLLAYHLLRTASAPLTPQALGRRVEEWTAGLDGDAVDLDLLDAVSELRRLSLVIEHDDGKLSPIGLVEARQALDQRWVDLAQTPPVEVGSRQGRLST